MVKATAILVGLIFLLIGIVGFVPAITSANGMLLGIFHVNTAHNIVHLASGIVFLLCGMAGTGPLQTFFSESLESFMGSSRFFGFFMVITRYSGLLPKRRHHPHRFVTPDFLNSVHVALQKNGVIYIATDHLDYFRKIQDIAESNSSLAFAELDVELPPTGFELIFRQKGTPIHWLVLRKISPVK